MIRGPLTGLAALMVTAAAAGGPAEAPANEWAEVGAVAGSKMGNTGYGGPSHGLTYVGDAKALVVVGGSGAPAGVWSLDLDKRQWLPLTADPPEQFAKTTGPNITYAWQSATYATTADGREVPNNTAFYVNQVCYDPDRKVVVGFSRGETVELDWATKRWRKVATEASPPDVTAALLCYDPVNREVVLATGGFSPVGGSDGTWLYDGAKQAWRQLAGPREVEAVRAPLAAARERLLALRWLTWKNSEFRATGREARLDDRAQAAALAEECRTLAAETKQLAALATANGGAAERDYDRARLAAAGAGLAKAAAALADLDRRLAGADPDALEGLYRDNLVPALNAVDQALSDLAVTPEPRMSAKLAYDSKHKVILCFGGEGQSRNWADTWVYHCEGRWWERRRPAVKPSAGESRALAFDAAAGLFVLIGSQRWATGKPTELWTYDAGTDTWQRLAPDGPGGAFWLEYEAAAGHLVALTPDLAKCWTLRLDVTSAGLIESAPVPDAPAVLPPPAGEYVLRDAATLADLRKWQAETEKWAKAVPANTWVQTPTHGTGRPNWGRTWSSIVYDPDRLQLYYRDGGHGSYHGSVTDHYDLPTGRWFRSDRAEAPPWPMGSYFAWGRAFSYAPFCIHTYKYSLYYNPLVKRLQRTGFATPRPYAGVTGSIHDYDPDTGTWSRDLYEGPGGGVPAVPDALLILDNFTRYGTKDGILTRRTAEGVETIPHLGQLPRAWEDHGFCTFYDPKRRRVMYYGGPKDKHQLFALDLTVEKPNWVDLNVKGAADGALPLSSREVVYIPRHDVFLMIAGTRPNVGPVALWALDPKSNTFWPVKMAGPVPRDTYVSNGLQYDPVSDLCFFIAAASGPPPLFAFRYAPTEE